MVFSITQKEDERRCKSSLRCRSRKRKFHEGFDFAKKMIFPCKNRKEFEKAENCWICGLFTEERRSHGHSQRPLSFHWEVLYSDAPHLQFALNLRFKKPKFIISQTMTHIFSSRISERASFAI